MGEGMVHSIGTTPLSHNAVFGAGLKGVVDVGGWFGSLIGVWRCWQE